MLRPTYHIHINQFLQFWDWCYEGCDRYQREEVAKSLGQHLHFRDGSKLQASYVRGQKNAAVLLEKLFEEILWDSQLYASAHGSDTDHHGRLLLNEALLKTRRRTGFLNILAVAHGDTQRSPSPTEGSPLNDATSVGNVSSPNNSRSPVDGPSTGHSQEEEAKRKMSLDDESHLSSKRPRTVERRDHDGGNSRSLQQSKHQGDETQEVGRPGTPHPKKELDRVPRHKRCHHVVDWLRDFSHKFRGSLNLHMAFLKKLGKGKRSEPPEFELENRRKHSSQSRSPGFRGGAGLNLRKPRKTGSPAELSLMTKDLLGFALEPTTTSQLHMANELPHSTPDSIAPLQSRTNKYSPRSLLEMAAPSQSPTPQDSPHSPPESIARQKPRKTQDFLDGGDQEF